MNLQQDPGLIVIIEDPFIRNFLRTVLKRAGHNTVAVGAQEGLDLVSSGKSRITAVITNTPKLFRAVAGRFPLIYTTSCPDPEEMRGFENCCCVLQKPFQPGQLLEALNEVSAAVIP